MQFFPVSVLLLLLLVAIVASAEKCKLDFAFINPVPAQGSIVPFTDTTAFRLQVSSPEAAFSLDSGAHFVHRNGGAVLAGRFIGTQSTSGFDNLGKFNSTKYSFSFGDAAADFSFSARSYGDKVVFRQEYFSQVPRTAVTNSTLEQFVSSSFPAFRPPKTTPSPQQQQLGVVNFAGFMAGNMYTQWATWSASSVSRYISGGATNTSALAITDYSSGKGGAGSLTAVMSVAESYMASSMSVQQPSGDVAWGANGNAREIPAQWRTEVLVSCHAGGVNRAMREWGAALRKKAGAGKTSEQGWSAHGQDRSLRYLMFSTDNGAFYYYNKGQFANMQDAILGIVNNARQQGLPFKMLYADSWWYYRSTSTNGGLLLWRAPPSVFPSGPEFVHNATQLPWWMHFRYFSPDTCYAKNPLLPNALCDSIYPSSDPRNKKFNFIFGPPPHSRGVPADDSFWNTLFDQSSAFGLELFEHDWLDDQTYSIPELTRNLTFGGQWLRSMGNAAASHGGGLSIQYCMSLPRHILASVEIPAVTQARASNDYQPQSLDRDYYQWRLGVSSLLAESLGIQPSKDNFWSSSTPQYAPHYDPFGKIRETRNRLQSLVSSLSNGVVQPGDKVGASDVALLMRSCRMDGLLLRPSQAATPLDAYFRYKSLVNPAPTPKQWEEHPALLDPVVHATVSLLGNGVFPYFCLLAANSKPLPFNITLAEIVRSTTGKLAEAEASGMTLVGWESNSSAAGPLVVLTNGAAAAPSHLDVGTSDEWTFRFFTFAPVFPFMQKSGLFVFLGETEKWIAASEQRVADLRYSAGEGTTVKTRGVVGEVVTLVFAKASDLSQQQRVRLACKIQPDETATFFVSPLGKSQCQ